MGLGSVYFSTAVITADRSLSRMVFGQTQVLSVQQDGNLLAVSPVPMVRQFGLWSGADLALATAAVLVLLPPLSVRLIR